MSAPTLAEVRAGGQPAGIKERRNEEHWAGRLYMRDVSPYFAWMFVRLGTAPNTLTGWMVVSGVLAGVAFAMSSFGIVGVLAALLGALLVQVYLMLDCADGEVARFTGRTSVTGVYLDRIGHYLSEVAILAGLGIRAQGGIEAGLTGGWVVAGFAAALGAALIKAETDNVVVARAKAGLTAEPVAGDGALAPRSSGLALARRLVSGLGFHRIIGAVELSLLILAAAVLDYWAGGGLTATAAGLAAGGGPLADAAAALIAGVPTGSLVVTRAVMAAVVVVAAVQTVLHLVSVLASRRLQ